MITGTKPLYQFEREVTYHKHMQRLKQIQNRSTSHCKSEHSSRPWVK